MSLDRTTYSGNNNNNNDGDPGKQQQQHLGYSPVCRRPHKQAASSSSSASSMGDSSDPTTKVQMHGVLLKKPYGHQATKWSKRFFIIKDGYLLYYSENEKKEFEKLGKGFNIHPKGVLPLGGCTVTPITEQGQNYAIRITHPDFNSRLILAADNGYAREKWMDKIKESGRITWINQRVGENMIQHLETQGLQLCKEKEEFQTRLNTEVMALRDEMDKNEALQRIANELEEENKEIAMIMRDLQDEYDMLKRELDSTMLTMKTLEEERQEMFAVNERLQFDLEALSAEKERTLLEMTSNERVTLKLSKENEDLSHTTDQLKRALLSIEERIRKVTAEKLATEKSIRENTEKASLLAEERESCSATADDIMISLKNLIEEKQLTENELKEEIMARMSAEKRLREAEQSLMRLDRSLRDNTSNMNRSVKNTMINNVHTLKKFFEDLALEAQMEADTDVMKAAVYNHKSIMRRAKSVRLATLRKSRCKTGDSPLFRMFRESTLVREKKQLTTGGKRAQSLLM